MKKYLIFIILLNLIFSCNSSKNSENQHSKNEINLKSEKKNENSLFNKTLNFTQNLNQFEGNAFVGALDGLCYMVLTKNSEGDQIAKLRYTINNIYATVPTSDKVDETYIITDFNRKSIKIDGLGRLKQNNKYADKYLHGKIKGLKASINNGPITDGSGPGDIYFMLDSLDYYLNYVMVGDGNWSFQGGVKLDLDQYILARELFLDTKLTENEKIIIKKSKDILELFSSNPNFISLGENKYKVLVSKSKLIENSKSEKSSITPLFECTIKNISNKRIDIVSFDRLYERVPGYTYSNASGDQGLNPFFEEVLKKSTLTGSIVNNNFYFSEFKSDKYGNFYSNSEYLSEEERQLVINSLSDEVNFIFNLEFRKPGYWYNYRKKIPINFSEMNIAQVLNNQDFVEKWERVNQFPSITFSIHDFDRNKWLSSPLEIYFELVDDIKFDIPTDTQKTLNIDNEITYDESELLILEAKKFIQKASNNDYIRLAMINDPDGYTNVRSQPNSKSKILFKIMKDDEFEVINPSKEGSWWIVCHNDNYGFMHKSRIDIIDGVW